MKKSWTSKDGKKPRRLVLSRETLQRLDEPKRLADVKGGAGDPCSTTDATTSTRPVPDACA